MSINNDQHPNPPASAQAKAPTAPEAAAAGTVDARASNTPESLSCRPSDPQTAALTLALDLVRAVDARSHGPRPDGAVFAEDNLRALLREWAPHPQSSESKAASCSHPPQPSENEAARPHGHAHARSLSNLACPHGGRPHTRHPHPDSPAHHRAHEEIERAHDIAVAPKVGTPPSGRGSPCFADGMGEEELEELEEMAEEADNLVS